MWLHDLESLVQKSYKEKSTWVGIAGLLFGLRYYREIDLLFKKVLGSNELVIIIIHGLAIVANCLFILYREKKTREQQNNDKK